MADDKITWVGVYHRDGEGRPLAMFTDGDQAQAFRRTQPDSADMMVAEAHNHERNPDVVEHFKATAAPESSPGAAADDVQDTLLRNQIRSEEAERRRRDKIQAEVSKELDEEERAARKDDKPVALTEPERVARGR